MQVISFQTFLNECLTKDIKKEAQKLLYESRPNSVKYLAFFLGQISLNGKAIKSVIPRDIAVIYVDYDIEDKQWLYLGAVPWVPTIQTAIMLYFYLLRPYLTEDDYFSWVYNVQKRLDVLGYDCVGFTFSSRCFVYPEIEDEESMGQLALEDWAEDVRWNAYDSLRKDFEDYSKWVKNKNNRVAA